MHFLLKIVQNKKRIEDAHTNALPCLMEHDIVKLEKNFVKPQKDKF